MSYDDIKEKLEELKNKDISDEQKNAELKRLFDEVDARTPVYNPKLVKRPRGWTALIFAMFFILYISAFLSGNIKYYVICGGLLLGGIVALIYGVCKKIKKIKKENNWRNIIKEETADVQRLCEEICNNVDIDLKRKRNKIFLNKIILGLAVILLCILLVYLLGVNINISGKILAVFIFAYALLLVILLGNIDESKHKYKSLYKKEVINTFIRTLDNNIEYSENERSTSNIRSNYKYSGFDKKNISEINVEDYCTQNVNDINIEMADVVSYKHFGRGRGRNTHDEIYFDGCFMVINTNNKYERTEILLNKLKLFNKKESTEIDNQIFNKYFKVYANNDVSKYLTSYLIEFLADFRERYGIDFEIIFEDKIYVRFYTDNMFEPQMNGKIVDEYSVYKFYVINKFAKELIEKLEI